MSKNVNEQMEALVEEELRKIEKMEIGSDEYEKAIKSFKILVESLNSSTARELNVIDNMNEQDFKLKEANKKWYQRVEPKTYVLVGTSVALTVYLSIFEARGYFFQGIPKIAEKLLPKA